MRILTVTHQYWPALGGSERYITSLCEALAQRGHQVDVFTTRSRDYHTWRSELPAFERLNGVNVHRFSSLERRRYTWHILDFGYRHYRRTRSPVYEPFIFLGNGPLAPGMFLRLLRQARRYDVIHLNCLPYSHIAYSYLAAQWHRMPVAVTPHIHVEQPETFDVGYFNTVLRGSDRVFADTWIERNYLIAKGVESNRVVVSGIGIRLSELQRRDASACRQQLGLPEEGPILLFFGRKVGYKGLDTVIQAFAALQQRHPSLILVAAGPETDESVSLQQSYAHLPGFISWDAVSDDEKLDLLNACDVLVLPSKGEAFGIVFLEAWAVGKPVIGAQSGATPAIISHGVDGFLVEYGDVASLAEKLEVLVSNPNLRARMGAQGHRKVRDTYTIERVADIVEQTYGSMRRRQPAGHGGY